MNYRLLARGAGIFSMFMDFVIPSIYNLVDVENIYIDVVEHDYNCRPDAFDFVFEQKLDESYKDLLCPSLRNGGFRKYGIGWGAIEDFKDLDKIKSACKKFKIKKEIINSVDIFPDALGVHFRGNDMNIKHSQYGIFDYSHYKIKIAEIIKQENIKTIFIASDNYQTIERINKDFGNDVYIYSYIDFIRTIDELDNSEVIQIKYMNNKRFWHESFIDMLTLAGCKYLLCRTSNFSNAAIAFSNSLEKIYRL
jgi:hypothetical protein